MDLLCVYGSSLHVWIFLQWSSYRYHFNYYQQIPLYYMFSSFYLTHNMKLFTTYINVCKNFYLAIQKGIILLLLIVMLSVRHCSVVFNMWLSTRCVFVFL